MKTLGMGCTSKALRVEGANDAWQFLMGRHGPHVPWEQASRTSWRQSGPQQSEAVWTEQKAWSLHRGYGQEVPAEEPWMNPGDHHEKRSELEGSARPGGRTSLNVPSQQAMGKQQQEGTELNMTLILPVTGQSRLQPQLSVLISHLYWAIFNFLELKLCFIIKNDYRIIKNKLQLFL